MHHFRFPLSAFSTAAFTLIEMVVVILIIGTLAAILLTGISSMIERAKNVQAKNDVTQIVTAVNAFYTEYGVYPATGGSDTTYGQAGSTNGGLFDTLRCYDDIEYARYNIYLTAKRAGHNWKREGGH